MENKDWFETWFDSPYYHVLYKDRDEKEANLFIQNLVVRLNLERGLKILDLACGRGRHAKVLNEMGFDVRGVDLSESSVAFAKQYESETLTFGVHDMREEVATNHFDLVLNLFTSFGYFNNKLDNIKVLKSVKKSLRPSGKFLLDFMNCNKLNSSDEGKEEKLIDGIKFFISKEIKNNCVIKTIEFETIGNKHHFEEKVSVLKFDEMLSLFDAAELNVVDVYGDYHFNPYLPSESDRLIILAEKT